MTLRALFVPPLVPTTSSVNGETSTGVRTWLQPESFPSRSYKVLRGEAEEAGLDQLMGQEDIGPDEPDGQKALCFGPWLAPYPERVDNRIECHDR
jgi:hypothetical protein